MTLRARLSAAFSGLVTGKAYSATALAWMRGDDVVDGTPNRFVSPYAQSAWVRAAVNHIAGEISGRPVKFYDGEREVDDAAFADWWSAPALGPDTLGGTQPRMPIGDVLRDLAAWAALEGEFFLCLDDAWLVGVGRRQPGMLTPFLIARPDRMQAIVQGGRLAGWRYTDAGGRQLTVVPEQVIHWKAFNPHDDWRGLGALQAARVAAEGAFLTGVYIRDLMRNNGDQGFIVVGKNGVASDAQREQIVADLRAKRAALRRGIAKDLFLTGDITVDRPEEQAAGADLSSGVQMSQQEVFVAFGVPPSLATVKQAYSIGKDSDRYQLITGTCQPAGSAIAGALARVASRMAGRMLTAELDWDDHPVMVEVRNSRIDALAKLWAMGVPVKVANDYLDLGLDPFPGWDQGYLPFSVAPTDALGAAPEPTQDPALAEPEIATDPDVAKLRMLVLTRMRAPRPAAVRVAPGATDPLAMFACTCGEHSGSQLSAKARDPKQLAHWRTLVAKRRETVRSFESAFGRVLLAARQETLRNLDSAKGKAARERAVASAFEPVSTKAAAADIVFDLAKFSDAFLAIMRGREKSALSTAGKQLFDEVGKDDPFAYPPEAVLEYLRGRESKLASVPPAVHEEIKAAIEEGLTEGDTIDQIADRIRGAFNDASTERARRIALTETSAAYGAGRDEAMRQAGVQYKAWLTSGNDNVRSAHVEAGQVYPAERGIPVDQPFVVGGEELMYPGDESGSAANVINCHCVSIPVAPPEEP